MHAMLVLSRERYSHSKFLQRSWTNWYSSFYTHYSFVSSFNPSSLKTRLTWKNKYLIFLGTGWTDSSSFVVHADSNTSYWCFSISGKIHVSLMVSFTAVINVCIMSRMLISCIKLLNHLLNLVRTILVSVPILHCQENDSRVNLRTVEESIYILQKNLIYFCICALAR